MASFLTGQADARTRSHEVVTVQGLRAIAALLVVLIHAGLPHIGVEALLVRQPAWLGFFRYTGIFGVDLFFAISGFIMLITNYESLGNRGAGLRFLIRRAIRIYPPYWLALTPVLIVWCFGRDRYMVEHVGTTTGVVQSILLVPNPHKFVLTVAWTLVWEMLFYVVFAALFRFRRNRIGIALAVWAATQIALYAAFTGSSNFYLHFIAAPIPLEFIGGAFVGLLYVNRRLPFPWATTFAAFAAVGIVWSWVSLNRIDLGDPNDLRRTIFFGIPAVLIVYAAVAHEMRGFKRVPGVMLLLGDASYAIYLWHLSILVVLRQFIALVHPAGAAAHAIVIGVTLITVSLVGIAVYQWFERPATRALNRSLSAQLKRRAQQPRLSGAYAANAPTSIAAGQGVLVSGAPGQLPGLPTCSEIIK